MPKGLYLEKIKRKWFKQNINTSLDIDFDGLLNKVNFYKGLTRVD